MPNEIWVLIEKARHADNIAAISRELLGKGRELAGANGAPLSALVLGSSVGGLAERAFAYGADKAGIVSVFGYANIIFSVFIGMALGDAFPDIISWAGICCIIFSGIIISLVRNRGTGILAFSKKKFIE